MIYDVRLIYLINLKFYPARTRFYFAPRVFVLNGIETKMYNLALEYNTCIAGKYLQVPQVANTYSKKLVNRSLFSMSSQSSSGPVIAGMVCEVNNFKINALRYIDRVPSFHYLLKHCFIYSMQIYLPALYLSRTYCHKTTIRPPSCLSPQQPTKHGEDIY